jgi:hypothetical protein
VHRGKGSPRGADFGSTLGITTSLALAGVALLMAALMLVVEPRIAEGNIVPTRQGAETGLYLAAFGLAVPLALYAGPRLAARIKAGPNGAALSSLTALLACLLSVDVLLVRLSQGFAWEGRFGALLIGVLLWWIVAAAALARAGSARRRTPLLRISAAARVLWAAAAVLGLGALLTVVHIPSPSPIPIAAGALAAALVLALFLSGARLPQPGPRWGLAVDGAAVVLLLLAIPDLVIVTPEEPGAGFGERFSNLVVQYHQDFLLGPANQVLGGFAMLVETSSQYGVGSIYLIAAWSQLLPIGYGTFGLLDGVLTALYFTAGFLVLRLAGVTRLLSVAALAIGVVGLVYSREYPVGAIVQEGPIRLGLPLALVLAVVAATRWPQRRTLARGAALAIVGLSSIWAMEMFVLTAGTLLALLAMEAYLRPVGRARWLLRQAVLAIAACVVAHILLVWLTLAAAGELPQWDQYLVFLEAFLLEGLGEITYDFSPWSPGLAVGAAYMALVLGLVLAVRLAPRFFHNDRAALFAITGTTAYGVLAFGYFVNRSAPHVLVYLCLPLLLAAVLWLSLLLRSDRRSSGTGVAAAALALALCLAVVLVTGAWPRIGPRFEHSALVYAFPGTKPARTAFDRLKDFPRFQPEARRGERLLERYMPGERRSLVLVKPDLDTEILMHSARSNALPLPDAIEDSFVGAHKFPLLRRAVVGLQPGRRMLLDRAQLAGLAALKRDPVSAPSLTQVPSLGTPTTPLQVRTLAEIDKRFRLSPLHAEGSFVVVELEARR